MAERLTIEVNDPPSCTMPTEEVERQLHHALMRREEWNARMKEGMPVNLEYARWAKLVEHWEVELFRREHHVGEKNSEKTSKEA